MVFEQISNVTSSTIEHVAPCNRPERMEREINSQTILITPQPYITKGIVSIFCKIAIRKIFFFCLISEITFLRDEENVFFFCFPSWQLLELNVSCCWPEIGVNIPPRNRTPFPMGPSKNFPPFAENTVLRKRDGNV